MNYRIGVDYYPEHWPEERWRQDVELMKAAGFNSVRLAEFAWVKMEPEEGQFDFSWLDRSIELFAEAGISVILCTPAASMPRWVALKYPDAVACDKQGHRYPYGGRRNSCYTNRDYLDCSLSVTKAMAAHFRSNPAVVGWQVDNELWDPTCYCDGCRREFSRWLRKRHGDIDGLNNHWGTIFWGHTYPTFDSIGLPAGSGYAYNNPSHELDFRRFHSESVQSFLERHVELLRSHNPTWFVTHNTMGFHPREIDGFALARSLDFVSLDNYFDCTPSRSCLSMMDSGASDDLTRSLRKQNFMIMETNAGPIGGKEFGHNLRPGSLRRIFYHHLAHGCDGYHWFRWRTCRFGLEQYWHGLLGHDGEPGRRFEEACLVSSEIARLWPEIEGSVVRARVAIELNQEDIWAFQAQPIHRQLDPLGEILKYYRSIRRMGIDVDFVHCSEDLSPYRLVIAGSRLIVSEQDVARYRDFVRLGGTMLFSFRSGVKDRDNLPLDRPLPGLLSDLCGIRIDEYEALYEPYSLISCDPEWLNGSRIESDGTKAVLFADWIRVQGANPILRYQEDGLEEYAAVTAHQYGDGSILYAGCAFPDESIYGHLVSILLKRADLRPLPGLPEGVETCERIKGTLHYRFYVNHSGSVSRVEVEAGVDLISGLEVEGVIRLAPNQVCIVRTRREESEE